MSFPNSIRCHRLRRSLAGPHACAVLFATFWHLSASAATLRADNQFWNEIDVTHKFGAGFLATATVFAGIGENAANPAFDGAGLEVDWRVHSLTVSTGEYAVSVRSAESRKRASGTLPFLQVSYGWNSGRVSFSDRSRLDELSGIAGSPKRYRNRLSLDCSLGPSTPSPHLVAADEVFYDWSSSRWSINRAQVGLEGAANEVLSWQLHVVRQHNVGSEPTTINALWLILQVGIK